MMRSASLGFTLIELMVGLGMAALLLVLGMPSFVTYARNSEIRSTTEALMNGLRAAKAEAANRNVQVHFELPASGDFLWTIWALDESGNRHTIQDFGRAEA